MKERDIIKNPFDVKLGEILKVARKSKRLSQTVAGEKLGCSKQMMSFYENGFYPLSASQVRDLCKLYGIDFGETLRKADE